MTTEPHVYAFFVCLAAKSGIEKKARNDEMEVPKAPRQKAFQAKILEGIVFKCAQGLQAKNLILREDIQTV